MDFYSYVSLLEGFIQKKEVIHQFTILRVAEAAAVIVAPNDKNNKRDTLWLIFILMMFSYVFFKYKYIVG
jgi:hypothetical protein